MATKRIYENSDGFEVHCYGMPARASFVPKRATRTITERGFYSKALTHDDIRPPFPPRRERKWSTATESRFPLGNSDTILPD